MAARKQGAAEEAKERAEAKQREAEGAAERLRGTVEEQKRLCAAVEARLQETEAALQRAQQGKATTANLAHLKQVVEKYIAMDDGEETDALFQVIATFLQFDAATVEELQRARQRKAAAQRGLMGRASLLFS
eukprot:Transcript_4756.p9 GENE.Transcript_4756~~Transcript_4756.p9  ORF type:complete len:132 (+),score=73.95 Transcript_4756:695-1090(+)